MTGSAKILIYSRDPGPANVMIAVYEALSSAPILEECSAEFRRFAQRLRPGGACEFLICAKDPALGRWRQAGHAVADWHTLVPPETRAVALDRAVAEFLRDAGITAMVTGAGDVDDDTDRMLWRVARPLGIACYAFLDFPTNLDRRFTESDGTVSCPDAAYVPDESYVNDVVAAGIPKDCVFVLGDMQYARFRRVARQVSDESIAALRGQWRAVPSDGVILFVSECTSEMAVLRRRSPPYSEFETLDSLIAAVRDGAPVGGRRFEPDRTLVVVRPHPRDSDGKYDDYDGATAPRVAVSGEGTSETAILAADLVVGMDSTMLYEAEALGQKAVSLVTVGSFARRRMAGHGG